MALQVKKLERVFKFKENKLPDPNPSFSPQEVLEFYTSDYPELTNANVGGPEIEDDKTYYEFKTTLGTKG